MAFIAGSVFEIQTGGNDTNGGGFETGATGTDYSLVAAKRTATGTDDSTTDAVAVGTTTITSATANFGTSIVGNIISLSGGTGTLAQTWRAVRTRVNATTITVDAAVAAGTGITMNIGGALATPGGCGLVALVNGNIIYIKAGSYSTTTATNNVANGCFSKGLQLRIEGYNTVRGDLGSPPVITASGISTFTLFTISANGSIAINLSLDGDTLTSSKGLLINGIAYKITTTRFTNNAFTLSGNIAFCINCIATACTTQAAFNGVSCINCVASGCTVTPFSTAFSSVLYDRCIAYSNTGASTRGFNTTAANVSFTNCVAYSNGNAGFRIDGAACLLVNCVAESNTGSGFDIQNVAAQLINCGAFSAGTNFSLGTSPITTNIGSVVGSGSFFTNAAAGDFSLNNTASRGAALRAAGIPGVFPGGLTTGYLDIGAAQHQDSGSGGGETSYVF